MKRLITIACLLTCALPALGEPIFVHKHYSGFSVVIDCRHNGPIAYEMALLSDSDNFDRGHDFESDPSVPTTCQMTTGNTFQTTAAEEAQFGRFQRGHLADANSLDSFEQSISDSFFVNNMLPQSARFNGGGGAWRRTEEIAECYREITALRIWGGVLWGTDASNDLFVDTHSVITPDRWWKLIYRFDTNTYIAWIFDNNQDERRAVMDGRIVTLEELKAELEYQPDFGPAEGATASTATWVVEGSNPLRCEGIATSSG